MLNLNYTYRIYPDAEQVESLNEWLETCRGVYNYALRELKDWMASRKCPIDRCSKESEYIMAADYPFPGYQQQQNNLPKAKKDYPRLKAVPSQVLQTTIRRLHDAWDFFRNRGYGFPRFQGLWGKEIGCQVGLSGAFCQDLWRSSAISNSDVRSLHRNL